MALIIQDEVGGLEVRAANAWIPVAPDEGTIVCQFGDMMERWSGGAYDANVHRVVNHPDRSRYSLCLFLQPAYDDEMVSVQGAAPPDPEAAPTFERCFLDWMERLDRNEAGYVAAADD